MCTSCNNLQCLPCHPKLLENVGLQPYTPTCLVQGQAQILLAEVCLHCFLLASEVTGIVLRLVTWGVGGRGSSCIMWLLRNVLGSAGSPW